MFCPSCGKEIPDRSKVCGYCGHPIPERQPAPPPAPPPTPSPVPPPADTPAKVDAPKKIRPSSAPRTLSRPLRWALGVLLAVLLNLVLLLLVKVDTLGTYTLTLLAGPLAGVLVVALTLSTTALFIYDPALYYLLPHLLVVLVTWLAIRFGWTRKWWQALITGLILGLLFAIFSVLSSFLAHPEETRAFIDFIHSVLGSLLTNIPLQTIAFLLAWGVDRWFGKRLGLRKPA